MGINGVSTNYYSSTYTNTQQVKATDTASFTDIIAEKAESDKIDWEEEAFKHAGPNAPQSVKDAWMEAAKETGANGLGLTSNGQYHTEMLTQQIIAWYNGGKEGRPYDVLGSSVQSAIRAAQQAVYNFDHPLEPNKVMSIEERQYHMKERQFYAAFLEKLEKLQSEQSDDIFSAGYATMSANPSFTVTSYEEIMKNWYEQIKANHEKNYKPLAEVILEGDPQARYRLYKLAGSSKVYTFDEYVRNMEEELRKQNEK